ncbi:MAG: methyltransferase domain-containing protein [Alcaligenaceae bacterium]|nr:methyltransferase domain-containing protein [Alcaligenaceae bacterium]
MENKYRTLQTWFQSQQGQYVLNWEIKKIHQLTKNITGHTAVQIGLSEHNLLLQSPMLNKVYIEPAEHTKIERHITHCPPDILSLDDASTDLVILAHTLEITSNPYDTLKEVQRILKPSGRMITIGFNPYSLWTLTQWLPYKRETFPFKRKTFVPVKTLQGWIQQLGLTIDHGEFGLYIPILQKTTHIKRWDFLNKMGDRWWPSLSGLYIVSACMQPFCMTPTGVIKERIKQRLQQHTALAPNSTKSKTNST